jgi:hypothetical protein
MRAYLADLAAKSANIGTLGIAEPQVSRQIAMTEPREFRARSATQPTDGLIA